MHRNKIVKVNSTKYDSSSKMIFFKQTNLTAKSTAFFTHIIFESLKNAGHKVF